MSLLSDVMLPIAPLLFSCLMPRRPPHQFERVCHDPRASSNFPIRESFTTDYLVKNPSSNPSRLNVMHAFYET